MHKPLLKNDRLLRALRRESVDCTPVWLMRQAGRYLPEYRATRQRAGDFLTLCKTPELACEVTLQPLARFPLDAAILFSDILTIPDAMGLGLYFAEGEGPKFERPIRSHQDIVALPIPDPYHSLEYVNAAVRLISHELAGKVPLIGFSGSPFTIATYMVEGESSKSFTRIKSLLYSDPLSMHLLLDKLAQSVTQYLNAQIASGIDVVMIFDTWGGLLTTPDYAEFSLRYMQQIISALQPRDGQRIPVILFTKNGNLWLEQMAATGADALGLDWCIEIADAKERVGHKVALQGNLDPGILYAPPERIRTEVHRILQGFGHGNGHIFNLGHGIHPDIPPEHVAAFVDAVHKLSAPYHQ